MLDFAGSRRMSATAQLSRVSLEPGPRGASRGQDVSPPWNAHTNGSARASPPGPSVTEHNQHMALSATVARTAPPVPMQDHFKGEDFVSLLDETLGQDTGFDGSVETGVLAQGFIKEGGEVLAFEVVLHRDRWCGACDSG